MDELDERLVERIDSGMIRATTLARKLNEPLSTIHARLKKLENEGVVRGYKGDIDWRKAGMSITAYILVNIDINLLKSSKRSQDRILKELLSIPYVKEGHIITGEADILIKIVARDTEHLKQMLLNKIDGVEGIVKTKTIVVL